MNRVDVALAAVLLACVLRGYWRGFFRECFGVIGLVGGVVAAGQLTPQGTIVLHRYLTLPPLVEMGAAFVVIFALVDTFCTVLGVLLHRLAGGGMARAVNRLAGAAAGGAKGAVVLAFLLLFFHLFPVVPDLDERVMSSSI